MFHVVVHHIIFIYLLRKPLSMHNKSVNFACGYLPLQGETYATDAASLQPFEGQTSPHERRRIEYKAEGRS